MSRTLRGQMGLFRSDKWECNRCGETHRSNPSECSECGYTVLTQYHEDEGGSAKERTTQPVLDEESRKKVWYCDKCKQKHTAQPEQCKVCGTEEFTKVGGNSANNEEDHQYSRPDENAETISNVREATSSPEKPASGSNLGLYVRILVFVVIAALILYLL